MMLKLRIKLILLLLASAVSLQAQIKQYPHLRELNGISTTWHSLQVPNQVFKSARSGLEDLRIYGTKGKDTIEIPYILEQSANQITDRETPFTIINQSSNANGYFYTFQASTTATINQIKLSFKQTNFDWKVTLEGSNNNNQWFTILSNYRILAIKNSSTDYQFTQLNFPTTKYSYFRMVIKANEQPLLTAAKVLKTDTLKGIYRDVNTTSYHLFNDAKNKQSIIDIVLPEPAPLSNLKINIHSDVDFYRAIKIEAPIDSFKTDKGTQYNYALLYEGTISSLEDSQFQFGSILTSRLKVTINNDDNKPLHLNSIALRGPIYELIARFEDINYQYALYYGNKKVRAPAYELKNFEHKIPISLTALQVGEEKDNPDFTNKAKTSALFENKTWLWTLIAIIIALLGFFAYKMLSTASNQHKPK